MDIFEQIAQAIQDGLNSAFERWDLILWQLIATIILIVALRFFLWKPITEFLEKRQEALTKELHDAKYERERITQIKNQTQKDYEAMKAETKELKNLIIHEAQTEKERIISEARHEARRRLTQIEHDIAQEIRLSNERVKQAIKDIAFQVAEKLVAHEIDADSDDDYIDELIDQRL